MMKDARFDDKEAEAHMSVDDGNTLTDLIASGVEQIESALANRNVAVLQRELNGVLNKSTGRKASSAK